MSECSFLDDKPFSIETAKQGRALCKHCKQKCLQGELRIAKSVPNQFGGGKMKSWHHVNCIFELFLKQRPTTKRIEGPRDVEGWDVLTEADKTRISKKIKECNRFFETKLSSKNSGKKTKIAVLKSKSVTNLAANEDSFSVSSDPGVKGGHKDNGFREFRLIVADVMKVSGSSEKTKIISEMLHKGCDGSGFKGDIQLWCRFLLPGVVKRVFNLQTKQLIKIFSKIFHANYDIMMEYLEQGDVGVAIQHFFEQCKKVKPAEKSYLTLQEVDDFLETLSQLTKEDDQIGHFKGFVKRCTANDLKVIIRLIKHDLRMNAGAKHVLEALSPEVYQHYQTSKDIKAAINHWKRLSSGGTEIESGEKSKNSSQSRKKKSEVDLKPVKNRKSPKRRLSKVNGEGNNAKKTKLGETKSKSRTKLEKLEVDEFQKSELELPVLNLEEKINERKPPIPDYFTNMKLLLEEGVEERHAEWVERFAGCGGVILLSSEHEEATHVLHLQDTISEPTIHCANSAKHVIVEWIKDTVIKESLQDFRPYTVRWDPGHKP